jgi:hypothetical protein
MPRDSAPCVVPHGKGEFRCVPVVSVAHPQLSRRDADELPRRSTGADGQTPNPDCPERTLRPGDPNTGTWSRSPGTVPRGGVPLAHSRTCPRGSFSRWPCVGIGAEAPLPQREFTDALASGGARVAVMPTVRSRAQPIAGRRTAASARPRGSRRPRRIASRRRLAVLRALECRLD